MKLSTRARYGTRILVDLALHNDGRLPLGDVTRRQQVSRSYLNHLIAPLVDAGIIGSSRGSGGGIWLARDPDRIRLSEVIKLLEGDRRLVECIDRPEICNRAEGCVTRETWRRVELAFFGILNSISIQDIIDQDKASRQSRDNMCQAPLP